GREARQVARLGPGRDPLEDRRRAPRPRVRRRPQADRPALLYELGVAALHPGRPARGAELREVQAAVRGACEALSRAPAPIPDPTLSALAPCPIDFHTDGGACLDT